jgi:hypothetical protein
MRSCENPALKTAEFYLASNWQGKCIRALMRCDSIREHGLQHLLYNRSHRGHRHSPEIARVVLTAGVHCIQLTALEPVSEHGCTLDALGNALLARSWFRTAQLETEAHPALLVPLSDPARRLDGILDSSDMRLDQRSNLFRIIEVVETRSGGSDVPNRPFYRQKAYRELTNRARKCLAEGSA